MIVNYHERVTIKTLCPVHPIITMAAIASGRTVEFPPNSQAHTSLHDVQWQQGGNDINLV